MRKTRRGALLGALLAAVLVAGVAQAFVSDDKNGNIYRIVYVGPR